MTSTSRAEDLEVFAERNLRAWMPDAIVITGDLTDAKTPSGKGEQFRAEWREYKRVWRKLVDAAGLPETLLLDIRGNHDSFDVGPRGGSNDLYMLFSSRAARPAGSEHAFSRMNVDYVYPSKAGVRGHVRPRGKRRLHAARPAGSRVSSVQAEHDDAAGHAEEATDRRLLWTLGSGAQRTRWDGKCPSAALVSVDATPNPGLRNPTNFLGIVGPDMLSSLNEQLASIHQAAREAQCPPPVIIAYGHHTFSTLAYSNQPVMGLASVRVTGGGCGNATGTLCADGSTGGDGVSAQGGAATSSRVGGDGWAPRQAGVPRGADQADEATRGPARGHATGSATGGRVEDVLRTWDVSAYVCGHLHDTFGLRVHRMHPKTPAPGHLAELLLPDWKAARWFRLITVDPEAGMSFVDLQFRRDLNDQGEDLDEPVQFTPADPTRVVEGHVVAITSPPDARYSYLATSSDGAGSAAMVTNTLRVMLLPAQPGVRVRPAGGGGPGLPLAVWLCEGGLAGLGSQQGSLPLQPVPGQRGMYATDLGAIDGLESCTHDFKVQVVVPEPGGKESRSEWRPVRMPHHQTAIARAVSRTATDAAGEGGMNAEDDSQAWWWAQPQPLGLRLSELAILTVHWPTFSTVSFQVQWALLIGLLLAGRLLGPVFLTLHAGVHRLVYGYPPTAPRTPTLLPASSGSNTGGPANTLGHASSQNLGHRDTAALREPAGLDLPPPSRPAHSRSSSFTAVPLQIAHSISLAGSGPSSLNLASAFNRPPGLMARGLGSVFRPLVWSGKHCVARPVAFCMLMGLRPMRDMARLAHNHPDLWWALFAFALHLQWGPWMAGNFASNIDGWGYLTARGLWLPGPSGYVQHTLFDAPIVTNLHMTTAVLPGVLWLASVVAFWSDQAGQSGGAAGGKGVPSRLLSWLQILSLFVLVPLHCRLQAKVAACYGWASVWLAPATGWMLPLSALWLKHARTTVCKARRD